MKVKKLPELAYLNMSSAMIVVEGINIIKHDFNENLSKISLLDNVAPEIWENNIVTSLYRIPKQQEINIIYNNKNQVFERAYPFQKDKSYGYDLYNQSLKYLINNSDQDVLICCGDKIILQKLPEFNNKDICWISKVNNILQPAYLNIFNIKKMKKEKLSFNTLDEFIFIALNRQLKIKFINPEEYGMILPIDFDKYNNIIFRSGGVKNQLIVNHFFDTYNYRFYSYEEYYNMHR